MNCARTSRLEKAGSVGCVVKRGIEYKKSIFVISKSLLS